MCLGFVAAGHVQAGVTDPTPAWTEPTIAKDFYDWALENFLSIFISKNIPLPEIFLTDREQALINSIKTTFPNSNHMFCTWHISKNLIAKGKKLIKYKKKEAHMISHCSNLIKLSSTPEDFNASFERFASKYGEPFQKYMKSNWLPVVEKFENTWTKNLPHFDHRVTSRIESSHTYIKSHLCGPKYFFTAVINSIKSQAHKISTHHHQ